MKRKPRISRILWHPLLMAGVLALIFTACGGGGGGEPPLTYTGNTSPAVIDETNAEVMAAEAYEQGGGGVFAAMDLMLGVGGGQGGQPTTPTLASPVVKSLMTAVEGQDISSFSASDMQIMAVTEGGGGTVKGSCGGSATMSGSITYNDDLTGSISMSAQYNNYCEGNAKMAGGMTMTFTFTYTGDPQAGTEIITPESINIQMTMVMQDVTTGLTLKVEGYDITLSVGYDAALGMNYIELAIAGGTFYHYDHGYVSVQTTTPMRTYEYDPWPTSGVFVVSAGGRYVSIDADTGNPDTYWLDFNDGTGSVAPYPMELYWSSPGF